MATAESVKIQSLFEKYCGKIIGIAYLRVILRQGGISDIDNLTRGDTAKIVTVSQERLANLIGKEDLTRLLSEVKAV